MNASSRSRRFALGEACGLRLRQLSGRARFLLADRPATSSAVDRLRREVGSGEPGSAPIFILGSGWRTGSTLLQRMLNDNGDLLIWGEPYSEGAVVQRLAESLTFLDPAAGRFEGRILPDGDQPPSAEEWTATMTPPLHHLLAAQRAMLDRLFAAPARQHGRARWGIKEVVWDRSVIDLLVTLYPDARFVLLVRDPVAQWISYRPRTRKPWFYRWPERPIGSPVSFGRMWRDLVTDFVAADRDLAHATIVRYEDLQSPGELNRLTEFLDLPTPLAAESRRVGSSNNQRFYTTDLPGWERAAVRRLTAALAPAVGYA